MADHDGGYKLLFSHARMVEDLIRGFVREEVKTMLADRVVEWTQEWERGGVEKTLSKVRAVLIRHIEARFGPLSEEVRERLDEIDSVETLMEMMGRVPVARSLDDLGLA